MAKGIGNGFPMAAVVTTNEIAATMSKAIHFNTFGGNPMASAVGIAVLDAIEEDKCQENSLEIGTYFLKELAKLKESYQARHVLDKYTETLGLYILSSHLFRPLEMCAVRG